MKEELFWRLYVDTYNHLTLTYGDEVIDREQSLHSALVDHRPADLSAGEVAAFLEGLPRRYVQLFSRDEIYKHVHVSRDLAPDMVNAWLARVDSGWELTVLTHDRPFLFSNIAGVLSSLRHGYPARLRLHQADRPHRRHVSFHRRRTVPRAQFRG